jgi:hypothetical protein
MMILVFESVVCFFAFLGIFRWEQYYSGEGIALSPFDRTKRMLGIGIFTVLCIAFAILLSSNKSFLPFDRIVDLLNLLSAFLFWVYGIIIMAIGWIMGLFIKTSWVDENSDGSSFLLPSVEESSPLSFLKFLKYGLIVLAAAGFLWFMISPLLNRGKVSLKGLTFRQKLIYIIKEWFNGILTALSSFLAFIRTGKTMQKFRNPGSGEIRRATENILGAYSIAKKRDIRRSATLFARLIIWGGEVWQVVWKPSHAPGEYCDLLAESAPSAATAQDLTVAVMPDDVSAGIIRCGEIFEKALYSAEILSDEERKEFKYLIDKIVSYSE